MAPTLSSALTLSTLGLASKAFLNLACRNVRVEGLEHLLAALKETSVDRKGKGKESDLIGAGSGSEKGSSERARGGTADQRRGIVTICNHISVCDDPMTWGILPLSTFFPFASPRHTSRNIRWTLGASDIMFTNPVSSSFFSMGQVIETVRGGGIFQPAIDEAIKKLQAGDWINIYPEGFVNQPNLNPPGGLRRFKWGVSRILMDSDPLPTIIPIWISGFDSILPDTRRYLRVLPRPWKSVSVTIGSPMTGLVEPVVREWKELREGMMQDEKMGVGGEWGNEKSKAIVGQALEREEDAQRRVNIASTQTERLERGKDDYLDGQEKDFRIRICDILFKELQTLGMKVEKREGKDTAAWRNAVPTGEGGYHGPLKR